MSQGDSSSDSDEPGAHEAVPINFEVKIKDDPSADKSDSSEPKAPADPKDVNTQSLSRKKSEQRLTEISSKFPPKTDSNTKSTATPTLQTKPALISPFNSDNFFTHNFDEQEMEAAIEQLKNSSGKMADCKRGSDKGSAEGSVDDDPKLNDILMKTQVSLQCLQSDLRRTSPAVTLLDVNSPSPGTLTQPTQVTTRRSQPLMTHLQTTTR